MRLSTKHPNQQTVEFKDFSGGLNTSLADEAIAQNELARAYNVELDRNTGLLRTVQGVKRILFDTSKTFNHLGYDGIENKFVLVDSDRKVYTIDSLDSPELVLKGTLTGTKSPSFTEWEDGLLIASGGKLQYLHGGTLETIDESPTANGVYVQAGRVVIFNGDEVRFSGVGDEHEWTVDTNDPSKSQWLQIGYKDGGKVIGLCSFLSDMAIFKDNGHAYHLNGTFPDWQLVPMGRKIDCRNETSYCDIANHILVLGKNSFQSISPTNEYGDMRADDIGLKVHDEIVEMGDKVKVRFLSSLNQVWIINNNNEILFLDLNSNGYFKRRFNYAAIEGERYNLNVVDAVEAEDRVYLLKDNGLSVLDDNEEMLTDENEWLAWSFSCKALVSNNDYLTKRIRIDTTPYNAVRVEGDAQVGAVRLVLPQLWTTNGVWHNYAHIFHNRQKVYGNYKHNVYINSDEVYDNFKEIYLNPDFLWATTYLRAETRCVDRNKAIRTKLKGAGGQVVFNLISFDIAEV